MGRKDHVRSWSSEALNKVSIRKALDLAQGLAVNRKVPNEECLISRWTTGSHTSVAARGKFDSTLEDVCALNGLPFFKEAHAMDSFQGCRWEEVEVSGPSFDRVEIPSEQGYLSVVCSLFWEWCGQHREVSSGGDAHLLAILIFFSNSLEDGLNNYVLLHSRLPFHEGWEIGSGTLVFGLPFW